MEKNQTFQNITLGELINSPSPNVSKPRDTVAGLKMKSVQEETKLFYKRFRGSLTTLPSLPTTKRLVKILAIATIIVS